MAIHPTSGDVYVAGYTFSTNFPGTAGGAQATNAGGGDAFVARFNGTLTTLNQATYLGGSGSDSAYALGIHPLSGEVYVPGATGSTNFPGTAGGLQATNAGGGGDAFVARLNDSLTALKQATYLGGSGGDQAKLLAIHPTLGDVYVAGLTSSTNLPGTAGGARAAYGGGTGDVFVARLTADLALAPQQSCSANSTTLCLNNGRFKVQTQWTTPEVQTGNGGAFASTGSGAGQAVALTSDTGYFWFFSANNVEMVLKVVDGRAVNNRFWVFAGGLTNVNVVITVTDTLTGTVKTYTNPQNTAFQPIQDTAAFAGATAPDTSGIISTDSFGATATDGEAADMWRSPYGHPASPASFLNLSPLLEEAACAPNATTLCLNSGRFRVQTQWTTPQGQSGAGQAVALTGDTGYFWFFSSNNVEMVIKVVDGRPVNNRYWVFAGGLTNVNVVITVTDSQTGTVNSYTNPQGTAFQPIQDTSAFAGP
jgi:hypothetical protein